MERGETIDITDRGRPATVLAPPPQGSPLDQDRAASDPVPDFSSEPPAQTIVPLADSNHMKLDAGGAVSRVQRSSELFGSYTDIDVSDVSIAQVQGTRYYLNSEG